MATKKQKKLFTPEMAETIIELGKQGASQKAMFAAIGISKDTAAKWKKEDPVFMETMSMATTYGQAYWENMMLATSKTRLLILALQKFVFADSTRKSTRTSETLK